MFVTKFRQIASSVIQNNQIKSAVKSRDFFWRQTIDIFGNNPNENVIFKYSIFPVGNLEIHTKLRKNIFIHVKHQSSMISREKLSTDTMATKIMLIACGSFNPPTPMHFRMFGK